MSKKSTTAIDDDVPITRKDIDAGRLVLRKREAGRVVPCKKRVTLYLDAAIVEHFNRTAGERGYQTLINETLRRSLEHADIESTIRKVIREELKNSKAAQRVHTGEFPLAANLWKFVGVPRVRRAAL